MSGIISSRLNVIVLGAFPDSVVAFRGELIRSVSDAGADVTVMSAAAEPDVVSNIEELGVRFLPYSIKRNGLNPASDFRTLRQLREIFKRMRPDAVLAYTIKPVIWGAIAARVSPKTKFFALVTGLGFAFAGTSLKRRLLGAIVVRLYRFALKRAEAVIFQNPDNRDLFIQKKIVPASKCHVVSGSGVHIGDYSMQPLPDGPPKFLLIARLLGEKGIREYTQAARIVQQKHPEAKLHLVGPADPSPDGIPLAEVQTWHDEGTIEYLGATNDVRPFITNCHIYCLPSYHEGMPRTVLESMAMGRPILTTDVSGCKETVENDVNGWLVPHANTEALAVRMIWFIENRNRWQEMGDASRRMAEEKFDVRTVNQRMLEIMGIEKPEDE